MSDLVRGALIAIPKHQYESSEALGMSRAQTYWYIIIPQTVRRLIPLSINLITRMIKTTSLVLMIGEKSAMNSLFINLTGICATKKPINLLTFWENGYIIRPTETNIRKIRRKGGEQTWTGM